MPLPTTTVSHVASLFSAGASGATSVSIQIDLLRSSPTFIGPLPGTPVREQTSRRADSLRRSVEGERHSDRPFVLDARDAILVRRGVGEIAAALQDLERVFLVGEADGFGARQTKQRVIARLRFPRRAMRVL